jgi:hypothetical protein
VSPGSKARPGRASTVRCMENLPPAEVTPYANASRTGCCPCYRRGRDRARARSGWSRPARPPHGPARGAAAALQSPSTPIRSGPAHGPARHAAALRSACISIRPGPAHGPAAEHAAVRRSKYSRASVDRPGHGPTDRSPNGSSVRSSNRAFDRPPSRRRPRSAHRRSDGPTDRGALPPDAGGTHTAGESDVDAARSGTHWVSALWDWVSAFWDKVTSHPGAGSRQMKNPSGSSRLADGRLGTLMRPLLCRLSYAASSSRAGGAAKECAPSSGASATQNRVDTKVPFAIIPAGRGPQKTRLFPFAIAQ